MTGSRVLVVEDDRVIGSELTEALAANGYDTFLAETGAAALERVERMPPDLTLLDLGLPDMDGVALCRRLRVTVPETVIVVLTARTEEFEVVVALDAGADDYLIKPFRLVELLARVRAHLRRQRSILDDRVLTVGDLSMDVAARRVFLGDVEVPLRPKEFDLLALLASRAGQAVTREEIMDVVWDENWMGSTKTLDVHVFALRRRLVEYGGDLRRIVTVRGHGYRYEP